MRGFGLFLIIIGLVVALIGVMNNQETDYDSVLRSNRESSVKSAQELRNLADAVNAFGRMGGQSVDTAHSDGTPEKLERSAANDAQELEDRAKKRNTSFVSTLVVAGVFIVSGLVMRTRQSSLR